MAFNLSGSIITQTGTDNDLSGLSGIAGVTVDTNVGGFDLYKLGSLKLRIDGTLSICGSEATQNEVLVAGEDAAITSDPVIDIRNGGTLNVGFQQTEGGDTSEPKIGRAVYQPGSGKGFADSSGFGSGSNSFLRMAGGSTFNWICGTIDCWGGINSQSTASVNIGIAGQLNKPVLDQTRVRRLSNPTQQWYSYATGMNMQGMILLGDRGRNTNSDYGTSFSQLAAPTALKGYEPRFAGVAFAGSSSLSAGNYLVEDYAGGLGTPVDIQKKCSGTVVLTMKNCGVGTDLNVTESSGDYTVRVEQTATGTITDASGTALSGAFAYLEDNAAATYTDTSDGTGAVDFGDVLTGLSADDQGAFTKYYSAGDVGTARVIAYDKLISSVSLTLRGVGGSAFSAALIADASVTEANKATVDAYTELETSAKFYDRAKAFLIDNYTGETETIVSRSGTEIDLGSYDLNIDATATPAFAISGNTITIHADTFTGDLTTTGVITLLNGAVVNGTRTDTNGTIAPPTGVTVTASESSSTIVIYEAGTQTVLANTVGTSTTYSSTSPVASVDYVVLKAGFEPIRVAGITLTSGSILTNSNAQREDIEYQTPSGDVTLATYGINWSYNAGTERLDVASGNTSTVRNAYSALMDLWIDSADGVGDNPAVANVAFPIAPEGPKRFTWLGGAEFTSGSLTRVSRAGFEYTSGQFYSGITDRQGTDFAEAWAYAQSLGGAVTSGTGRLDRVVRTDNAQSYLVVKRLANGFYVGRNAVTDTFSTLEPDQYDFTLPAEALPGGTGTATGITIETAGPYIVGGESFSYRITSDLTGDQIIANLSAYRENDPSTWFRFPQMVFPQGSGYITSRGLDDSDNSTKGCYVRTATGSLDHPDFISFEADNGNPYIPPVDTDVELTLNPGTSAVLVLDNTDTIQQFTDTETGTFNYTIPASASGTWQFVTKTKGYAPVIVAKAADGVDLSASAQSAQDAQPDGTVMYTGSSSALIDVTATGDGSRMNLDIGDGAVSPQIAYDETEDELFTQDGLEYLYNGGGRVSLAVLPGGNYFFMNANVRIRRRLAGDANAQLNAFAISTDGIVVDDVNGGVLFLSTTDADKIAAHLGAVWIDPIGGNPGTAAGDNGTLSNPVSNVPDALAIAQELGLLDLAFINDATIAQDVSGYLLRSASGTVTLTMSAGNDCSGARFSNVAITGAAVMDDRTTGQLCKFANVSGFAGAWSQARFQGTTTIAAGATEIDIEYSSSAVAGSGKPVFDLSALSQDCALSFRNWNGGLDLRGSTRAGNAISMDMASGAPLLDASCTAGDCVVRGVGKALVDNSTMTVDSTGYNPGGTGGGSSDWTDPEKEQMRSALGIDGTKTAATGGQLQGISTQTTRVDGLIENSGGDRFTQKALEEAPGTTGTVDANIVSVTSTAVTDVDDFKADVSAVATSAEIAALNDFDPANDTVANVDTVQTTVSNTDMRGTDGANTTVPDNAGIAAVQAQTDRMTFNGSDQILSDPQTIAPLDSQSVRDAMKLAPTAGAPAADSIDDKLDQLEVDTTAIQGQTDKMQFNGSDQILSDPQTIAPLDAQAVRDSMKLAPTAGAPAAGSVDAELDAIQGQTDRLTFNGSDQVLSDPQTIAPLDSQSVRDAMKLAPTAGAPAADSIDDKLDQLDASLTTDTAAILAAIGALNDLNATEVATAVQTGLTDQGYTVARAPLLDLLTAIDSNAQTAKRVLANRVVISPDNLTVTVYEEDGTTPAITFTVSADQRERTP